MADGAALSYNNMSAFWQDPNWVLTWRHTTLEKHIIETAKRIPRNLLNDRETLRHQKAIDPETGHLVGYAHWILPASYARTTEGTPEWPEAQVPAIGEKKEAEIRHAATTAIWNGNSEASVLDEQVSKIKKELLQGKTYLRLDYMAVHPDNQGKGIGTALVESGMREAEKMGLDIFVLAFKAGVGVYKRLGFRIEQELIQDDSMYGGSGEYGIYYMIYEQSSKSAAR